MGKYSTPRVCGCGFKATQTSQWIRHSCENELLQSIDKIYLDRDKSGSQSLTKFRQELPDAERLSKLVQESPDFFSRVPFVQTAEPICNVVEFQQIDNTYDVSNEIKNLMNQFLSKQLNKLAEPRQELPVEVLGRTFSEMDEETEKEVPLLIFPVHAITPVELQKNIPVQQKLSSLRSQRLEQGVGDLESQSTQNKTFKTKLSSSSNLRNGVRSQTDQHNHQSKAVEKLSVSLVQSKQCPKQITFIETYNYDPSQPGSRINSPDKTIKVSGVTEQQSTAGVSHQHCNKTIEAKDALIDALNRSGEDLKLQIKEKDDYKIKLKEKVEAKDSEIIRLKGLTGGPEVQELKLELMEVKVRLDERNNQLTEVKQQLKEWIDTANKLINGRADFDEWKRQFKKMSTTNSVVHTPQECSINSQDNSTSQTDEERSDAKMDDVDEQKESSQYLQLPERKQLFGFQNVGLTCYAGAALQCVQVLAQYLTGLLLFTKSMYSNELKKLYTGTFNFKDILAPNDSFEAFTDLIEKQAWKSKLGFKQIRHVVCRKCKTEIITEEPQYFVALECSEKSLEQCLKGFLKPEPLQGKNLYECAKCAQKTEADTCLKIAQTNDIIIVNLKRFKFEKSNTLKNNAVIAVPFLMTIDSCRYELIAFVLHCDSKTANTGHYKAYINCSTEWQEFDDDRVRNVKLVELTKLANQGYYYCYRRAGESEYRNQQTKFTDPIGDVPLPIVHCSLCNSDFEHFGAKFQHYSSCQGLGQANERVSAQYKVFSETASEREKQLIQTALSSEGSAIKNAVSKVNLIQEHGSFEFKKEFINNPDLAALAKLYEELNYTQYFNVLVQNIIAGPVADAQGNPVYAQNSTREILVGMLGKASSRKSNASLEKEVISMMKRDAGIALTLDERRSLEAEDIKKILLKHEDSMIHIRDYLSSFKDMRSHELFERVKNIFCDGIILPRLQQLFNTYNDFQVAFHSAGIQVYKICPGQKDGFVYVRLQDSANEFNSEFVLKLNDLIQSLRKQLEDLNEDQEVIDACFVQQIDCTQDMKGFFLSFDIKDDIRQLSDLMSMELTRDYPSFESLFTLLQKQDYGTEDEPLMLKQTRFKIYNKLLHFLESEQAKKKISMNFKGLLNCQSEFYQKLRECFESGLTRLEFSYYFYSFEESQKIDVGQYQLRIDRAFEQVNKLPQIRYQVPFQHFFNNFWNCSRPVFIFQQDSWTVIYAKHSISAYIGQTVKITQGRFDHDDKIQCIKRFGIPGKWCTVIDEITGKVYKVMKTGSKFMQIPVQSLNTTHSKSYDFPFDETVFKYRMSDKEVEEVKLVLESGKAFDFPEILGLVSKERKRDAKQKSKEFNNDILNGIDVTELLLDKKTKNKRWKEFNEQGQLTYGSMCIFVSSDKGVGYKCETCTKKLKAIGKLKKPVLLIL